MRVLADNTLGRLWLEMYERLPQLESFKEEQEGKRQTRYRLSEHRREVPHAAETPEAFKAWITEEADVLRDQSVDRLCRFLVPLPSRPVPRGKKNVREIRVLDPACGSGQFLLYAFDILFAMYREAEPDLDLGEIPALIWRTICLALILISELHSSRLLVSISKHGRRWLLSILLPHRSLGVSISW